MRDHDTALAEAQARFEMLFSNSVDGVFFMMLDEPMAWSAAADRDALLDYAFEHLSITQANPAMCVQMGSTREQLIGSGPRDRWAQDVPTWREKMRQLFDEGRASHRLLAPLNDGTYVDVEGTYVSLYDDQARITGYFGTQRDVSTERRTAERLELALMSGDIGIWEYDLVNQMIHFDKAWLQRLGYADIVDDVHPATWWNGHTHPGDMEELKRAFADHLSGKSATYRIEHRVRTADDRYLWLLSSGRVTSRDRDGKPLRFVGTSVDITERKQLQERVALAERMASIGTLAAGVAHEINNPLTYIVLNLTLLERQLSNLDSKLDAPLLTKLRAMVSQARYGTERVSGVVRDLQSLTRVRDDQITLVDPVAVLERCIEISDHQVRHRARLVRDLSPVPAVRGSEGRMVQLFLNLIINAAQAIPEGAADRHTIRVSTSVASDRRVCIGITDSGAGIPPEALGRIFDPFFTTKSIGEGSGLGLAICRSIVTSLQGEIDVESVPGKGTTFRVTLPSGTGAAVEAASAAHVHKTGLRVLVIDDEPLIGRVVEQVLTNHHVAVETSARAALSRLESGERFDRILCDLMMPDMTGMELFDQLPPETQERVVFLTGGAFTERAREFLGRVSNRRLDKPFDTEALSAVLE